MSCCISHQIVSNFRLLHRANYFTNVARIQIPVLTPFVGWVCCWFLFGYDRFLSGYSGFPLSSKTNISNFQEAFETHWVTSPVNFIWGPLIQVSLYFFCFQFHRRGWISASCSRHPHHLGGQCFCRVKFHRSWCRRTQTSGVFFRLYAEVMQL